MYKNFKIKQKAVLTAIRGEKEKQMAYTNKNTRTQSTRTHTQNAGKQAAQAAQAVERDQTWNTITGDIRIFSRIFTVGNSSIVKYTMSISRKIDDEWHNVFIPVYFAKTIKYIPVCDDDYSVVTVKNAFFTVDSYTNRNGELIERPALMITEIED